MILVQKARAAVSASPPTRRAVTPVVTRTSARVLHGQNTMAMQNANTAALHAARIQQQQQQQQTRRQTPATTPLRRAPSAAASSANTEHYWAAAQRAVEYTCGLGIQAANLYTAGEVRAIAADRALAIEVTNTDPLMRQVNARSSALSSYRGTLGATWDEILSAQGDLAVVRSVAKDFDPQRSPQAQGFGNCAEQACVAFDFLMRANVFPLCMMHWGGSSVTDHVSVLVGRGLDSVICDPWIGFVFRIRHHKLAYTADAVTALLRRGIVQIGDFPAQVYLSEMMKHAPKSGLSWSGP